MKSNVTATALQPSSMTSFRLHLQAELPRRCAKNPRYSLRSFATHLTVDHSTLSQLLRGRRPMTARMIAGIGPRLGLDESAIERFVAHEKMIERRSAQPADGVRQLTHDLSVVISDVCHYAILELVTLKGFRPNTRWIARVLGMTTDEVNIGVTRLLRLGLLEMSEPDRWTDKTGTSTQSVDDFTRTAIQQFTEQVRNLSLTALSEVHSAYREHSSSTLAIDTRRLPEPIELIARFRRELNDRLAASERDDVYQLEINLFPITTLKREQKKREG